MSVGQKRRAALGFSVHTGWAVMVAVSTGPLTVLDRRRIEMIANGERERPRFAYHAARTLPIEAAKRLIRACTELSAANAKAALRSAVKDLAAHEIEVVGAGVVAGNPPPAAPLEAILETHARVHGAEGELFRDAIRGASEALEVPVTSIRARELQARGAAALGIPAAKVPDRLASLGRDAGRPWAKDHQQACLAALVALAG